MSNDQTAARADVLDFYQQLPFNYRTAASEHAAVIRRADSIKAYPPLFAALKPGTRLLDVGCGAGWLINSAAYHHKCRATGIDFNSVAVERAREVAGFLNIASHFEVADLFTYHPTERFDVVTSVGVLHHTDDCSRGIRRLAQTFVAAGGRLFIGLYHECGRRPFLNHFAKMTTSGASEGQLYAEFRRLAKGSGTWDQDEIYLQSWFRDQVLHPHETQHTLAELLPLLDDVGFELEATSVNRFAPLPARSVLLAAERELEHISQRALAEGRYFPGFFVVMARQAP
jgi:SAM-dependent methyltransferase